jgi:3-isopropylmalate dehydrogenase
MQTSPAMAEPHIGHVRRVAVLPGDGIGPEVVAEAMRVLESLRRRFDLPLTLETFDLGAERYLATGETLPNEIFARLRDDFDGILVGAFGDPRVPGNEHARDILLGLRFRLDLYVNRRPVRLLADDLSPLVGKGPADIDFVIFRENTEGLYTGHGHIENEGTDEELAVAEMRCSYRGVERIIRAAFEYAEARGLGRVCLSDKANAIEGVGRLWRRTFAEVGAEFRGIEQRAMYIDALAMELVRAPEQFDVIVTGNLFGDIISDLGAQLQGGIGTAASANLHPGRAGLFEPVHGSAPTLVGLGLANPVGTLMSTVFMLEELGFGRAAGVLEEAVVAGLREGVRTADLGGSASTAQVGDDVLARIEAA